MYKSLFFMFGSLLCLAQFDAFAAVAPRGNARGSNNTVQQTAQSQQTASGTVSARSAARQRNVAPTKTNTSTTGNVSARAGKKQTVKAPTASTTSTSGSKVVSARAASKQKALQTGSKINAAANNTIIPQECQDAFYGCMDSFCMLDNISGGRCQCSDRGTELDTVLDEIVNLDNQTYIMATEGVERIQMGEAEEQVIARAKAVADKVTGQNNESTNEQRKQKLDLDSLRKGGLFNGDDDDDELFKSVDTDGLIDIKGDKLYKEAVSMCGPQVPTQCTAYSEILQMVYVQKIKSDCSAYENSLKQQRNSSQEKLLTAQKALRDAALTEFKEKNKYEKGQCITEFTKCMQTTAGCGEDYSGCVIWAAKENVKNAKNGTRSQQSTVTGSIRGSDITLATSTMESLLAKKEICSHITKQCVDANKDDAIWTAFLRNAAPWVKAAEEQEESKLRMNCIPSLSECFQNACKSNFDPNNPDGSYDMCLAHPETYKSLCKVQLEPCLEATGATFDKPEDSSLWSSLISALNAMKADACTNEVKQCLLSDNACGKDYSGCIGLDTDTILTICPTEKLTACKGKDENGNDKDPKVVVAEVAKGIALNIDNSLLLACQQAVDKAMLKACGSLDDCSQIAIGEDVATSQLEYKFCVRTCPDPNKPETCKINGDACTNSSIELLLSDLTSASNINLKTYEKDGTTVKETYETGYKELASNNKRYAPYITGKIDWTTVAEAANVSSSATSGVSANVFTYQENSIHEATTDGTLADDAKMQAIIGAMNTAANRVYNTIVKDPNVEHCINGRSFANLNGENIGKIESGTSGTSDKGRWPNLADSYRQLIATKVLTTVMENYNKKYNELMAKQDKDLLALAKKYAEIDAKNDEAAMLARMKKECDALNGVGNENTSRKERYQTATFNESARTCTVTVKEALCDKRNTRGTCPKWGETKVTTETIQM